MRIWRGLDAEGSEECTALGEPATLILLGDDYDGGHKAWVRWPDGRDDIVPGSQGDPLVTRGMEREKSGISIQTLLISACAAVAAAVIVPMIWERGTLIATAMTPVIVARGVRGAAQAGRGDQRRAVELPRAARPAPRCARPGAAVRDRPSSSTRCRRTSATLAAVRERRPVRPARGARRSRHHWKIALATGAVAFVIAVVALTRSELVFGGAATRTAAARPFFGTSYATPTATPTATPHGEATPTATPTATRATATPTATPTPTPTADRDPDGDAGAPTATP